MAADELDRAGGEKVRDQELSPQPLRVERLAAFGMHGLYTRHPEGGALRRLLKIGRAPAGLDPGALN